MKKIVKLFLMFIFVFCLPIYVDAKEEQELEIPSFTPTYVNDYLDKYSCAYRFNMSSESSIHFGTFDFNLDVSKKDGKISNINVASVSLSSYMETGNIGKIEIENNIINNSAYYTTNIGYSCPSLMVYLTDNSFDVDEGYITATFTIEKYNKEDYDFYSKPGSTVNRYYSLTNYEKKGYICGSLDKNTCESNSYCSWRLVDSGHKDYSCIEKKYDEEKKPEEKPESQMRTEVCGGYKEAIFNQTLEYSFSIDGELHVNSGSADLMVPIPTEYMVDKDDKLWDLWKNGKCCNTNMLGLDWNDNFNGGTLSCDSNSDPTWEYAPENPEIDIPDIPDDDTDISNCETIPAAIKEYITQALRLIRWIGLVLMIILGVLDFTKAVASDDQEAVKKAWQKVIKRLIAVIILFLLPMLVELILDLVNLNDGCKIET